MKFSKSLLVRSLLVVAALLSFGMLAATQAPIGEKPRRVSPAVLRILRDAPVLVWDKNSTTDESRYRRFLNTQAKLVGSNAVLRTATRDAKLASLKLTPARIREQLKIELIPDTELMTVLYVADDPAVSKDVTDAVLDSYISDVVESEKREALDRLDKLRKLWDQYQTQIKTKETSLKALKTAAGDSHSTARKVVVEALKRSHAEHSAAVDRLVFQRRVLSRQNAKAPELDLINSEVKDRQETLKEIETRLDNLTKSQVDLSEQREEIRLATRTAQKIGDEVERLEVELQAPERIRVASRAELE